MRKNKTKILLSLFFSALLIVLLIFSFNNKEIEKVQAGTGDNAYSYAWSENIGWISFNNISGGGSINYGVDIDETTGVFSGYAWSENIGWISFNQLELSGCPSGTCRAEVDLQSHDVSGWVRALAYGDGWDGWIKLRGPNYGVKINNITREFEGWAWGDIVIGWISFNSNNPETISPADYSVKISFFLNRPPYKPQPVGEGETWYHCWVSPQVALGTSIVFSWTYSDPDGDPQQSYEIWVDGDSGFSGSKFNNIIGGEATSYTLNLNSDEEGDWLSNLAWSTTYWWKVRVKDTGSDQWSEWSDPNSFTMNNHANPYPDFILSPSSPSAGEIVQLCAVQTGVCGTNQSICYDSSDTEISCSGETFLWTLPAEADFASTSVVSTENPQIKFTDSGDYTITLKIKDDVGSCSMSWLIQVALPLPEWIETTP